MTRSYVTLSRMKPSTVLLALLTIATASPLASAASSKDDPRKQDDPEPITWGVMGQTPGCVIFAEGHKTSGHFYGIGVSTKNVGKLTVVESEHYTLDQKEFLETQPNLDSLMQRAQKDHLKYVKIPEKYTPELLNKARSACKQDQ